MFIPSSLVRLVKCHQCYHQNKAVVIQRTYSALLRQRASGSFMLQLAHLSSSSRPIALRIQTRSLFFLVPRALCRAYCVSSGMSLERQTPCSVPFHPIHASCSLCCLPLPPPRRSPPLPLLSPSFLPSPARGSPPPMVSAAVARRFERSICVRIVLARYDTTRTSWMCALL